MSRSTKRSITIPTPVRESLVHQIRSGILAYPSENAAWIGLARYQLIIGKPHPVTAATARRYPFIRPPPPGAPRGNTRANGGGGAGSRCPAPTPPLGDDANFLVPARPLPHVSTRPSAPPMPCARTPTPSPSYSNSTNNVPPARPPATPSPRPACRCRRKSVGRLLQRIASGREGGDLVELGCPPRASVLVPDKGPARFAVRGCKRGRQIPVVRLFRYSTTPSTCRTDEGGKDAGTVNLPTGNGFAPEMMQNLYEPG